ncbi:MAG: histidine phosphatase family protein [Burkholderiales bacterium]|nr:phosphoglycerate mutase family protein [Burkholderiales bacterium]MDE1928073.1 histidine phosphatase family protein [Burkholderiales bacterium]MDE2158529.1 histidine phosphatase family protein [Burkholderiales bacterium]MDE2504695.1 histidine phosphatase family protein [Burkholderiales bacterium]
MGTLYLVRHGQASFGSDDYDRLSDLGQRQCLALGRWMRERGLVFEAVLRGTLRRQAQSLAAIAEGHGGLPAALEWPGLNEYDSDALVRSAHGGRLPGADAGADPQATHRAHFRLLRTGLQRWIAGEVTPAGMPSWAEFGAGVAAALDHVRQQCRGDALIVSSGGPIATAVAQVLGAPPAAMIELNMRIRNSAVTEFTVTPKRHALLAYNHLPHLDTRPDWVTYA